MSGRIEMTDELTLALMRGQAAFLGLAIGDALGATLEFTNADLSLPHREIVGGGWLKLPPGAVTDDTQMAMALARAIVGGKDWSLKRVADAFTTWLDSDPPDTGTTCATGILRYKRNGTLVAPRDPNAAGNGAAMRVLPVALYTLGDEACGARCALDQARITHNNSVSDAACRLIVRLVQMGLAGYEKEDLLLAALEAAQAEPELAFDGFEGEVTGYVADTLNTVLNQFFNTESFEECLVAVVNRGGDADTTGAIAGAIAGAFYGFAEPAGIPARWARAVDREVALETQRLAEQLVMASPFARAESRDGPDVQNMPRR